MRYLVKVKKPIRGPVIWAGPGAASDVRGHDIGKYEQNKEEVKNLLEGLILKQPPAASDGKASVPDEARSIRWNAQKGGYEVELEDNDIGVVVNNNSVRGVVEIGD